MVKLLKMFVLLALAATIAGCVGNPAYEEAPHHFSKDSHGNRIACYPTAVADEYECVPVYRRHAAYPYPYPYSYPYYDPFWSAGYVYGWPHHHDVIVVQSPPSPPPPPRWPRGRR